MTGADSTTIRRLVARVERRLLARAALEGAGMGIALAAALALAGWPARDSALTPLAAGLAAMLAGAAMRIAVARPGAAGAARAAERRTPDSRNLIFTAFELAHGGSGATRAMGAPDAAGARAPSPYVADAILGRAAAIAARVEPAFVAPAMRHVAFVALAAVLWVAAVGRMTDGALAGRASSATPMIDRVDVTVSPPAYARRAATTFRNPERIEVLEGSRVAVAAASNAGTVTAIDADSAAVPVAAGGGVFRLEFRAVASGFVSMEPRGDSGRVGTRRLLGFTVVPDAPPVARIVAPGKDLVVPDGRRALDVAIEASDDIGLASLGLRYTKASGSGERYSFVEGEVPVTVRRTSATSWSVRLNWTLDSLGLEPGDIVVYRAVVADARPGATPVESDAFIVEVAAPGSVAAGGFALDPDEERYALSQQMVVLKIERLLAARARVAAAAFADSAAEIAAEQRRVRAEFVFMMGGEVNDGGADTSMTDLNEEEEAAGEADLLAGREMNAGRIALRRATRAMSLAARDLDRTAVDTALAHARDAVRRLEEAFARNRIILRALAERDDLDPARRLSGALTELARTPRPVGPAMPDARAIGLRAALASIGRARAARAAAAPDGPAGGPGLARALSIAAEQVLRLDPSSPALQRAAASLSRAADAAPRDPAAAAQAMDAATLLLGAELRAAAGRTPAVAPDLDAGAARGRMVDLLRGRP